MRNSLVDDIGGGGTEEEVDRMRGVKKDGVYSGTPDPAELEAMGGRFLGLGYSPEDDEIISRVAPHICMKRKRGKQRRQDNETITEEWMENLRQGEYVLTKRRVLAFVMAQYDPHGIRAPMMLTAKLLLRKLYGSSYSGGWDDSLQPEAQLEWEVFLTAMLHMGALMP